MVLANFGRASTLHFDPHDKVNWLTVKFIDTTDANVTWYTRNSYNGTRHSLESTNNTLWHFKRAFNTFNNLTIEYTNGEDWGGVGFSLQPEEWRTFQDLYIELKGSIAKPEPYLPDGEWHAVTLYNQNWTRETWTRMSALTPEPNAHALALLAAAGAIMNSRRCHRAHRCT